MKNWKKLLLGTLAAVAASATLAVFAACQTETGITYSFVVDESQTLTAKGEAGTAVEFPEVSKEGYVFKGWYTNADFIGMPVTSATYESETTYYARWAKGYEVVFDLGGGTLDVGGKLYLEQGASISDSVQNYVPAYGEYQFGGWFVGDEPLAANERMTSAGITLTARYKAEYTVDVYLQSLENADTYVKSEAFATGYALIGDDYEPEVNVSGFTVTSHENEVTEKEISGNRSENLFKIYFDRNSYTLTLSANYPDGSFDSKSLNFLYEKEFTLPENTFDSKGCRFVGWATSPDAGFDDIIKENKHSLKNDEVLYAVWNVGYVDMFSGEDRIFVDPADSNKIILERGGIELEGAYDEIREVYTLRSTVDTSLKINVKLRDDGKFVYLSNRQGSYSLYTPQGTINKSVKMLFDDYDGCEYNSDKTFTKRGSYAIDDDGYYTATVIDAVSKEESTVHFIVGLAYDNDGVLTKVFRIRGEEYSYGAVPGYVGGRLVYPVLNFDGYGNVKVEMPNNQTSNYTYTLDNGIVTVYSVRNMQQTIELIVRLENISGQYVYENYTSIFDKTYSHAENSNITIKLNGCSTIVYTDGDKSYTGTYNAVVALNNGCHIIYVTEENGAIHTYFINGVVFTEEENVGGVYYFYEGNGRLSVPILVVKTSDDATRTEAAIYDIDGNFWGLVSRGILVNNGSSYTYTVDGEIAEWSNDKYSEITLVMGGVTSTSGSHPIYFTLSAKEKAEEGEDKLVSFSTLYVGEDGSKLTLTDSFAIYEVAGETTALLGSYTKGSGYITVTAGNNKYYFILNKATEEGVDNTFELLDNAPLTMTMMLSGTVLRGAELTLTGRMVDGKEEAIYSTGSFKFVGAIESEKVNVLGSEMNVYKFVGRDEDRNSEEVFYFTVTQSMVGYYFNYYRTTAEMVLGSFLGVDEDGNSNKDSIKITADNKFTYTYDTNKKSVGTWTSEERTVFGVVPVTVYTFIPDDADGAVKSFKFTLRSTSSAVYFLIEGESYSLTAADGSTLELDGETHVAQYTDKDGVQYENYFWSAVNVLDGGKAAFMMILNDEYNFFDVDGDAFTLRGSEQNSYFAIKNGSLSLEKFIFEFDGYGNVNAIIKATEEGADDVEISGKYTSDGDTYTITLENGKTYKGYLGSYTVTSDGKKLTVGAFYIEIEGYEGNYLNEADLSVLVLDSVGNAVRYSSYGVRESGSYTIMDDGLIYYMNSNATAAAVYAIEGNKVKIAQNEATYYANDLSAAVFTPAGNLVFGNGDVNLYVFNEDNSKFTTYTRTEEGANVYGFKKDEYAVTNGSFVYGGKTYNYFDGTLITLTSADGSKLSFTPSGSTTFSAAATYVPAGADKEEKCFVITWYNAEGEFVVTLSRDETPIKINGSVQAFNFTYEYKLDVNIGASSFEISEDNVNIGLIAYDYDFIAGNGMGESCLFIWAEKGENGEYSFSVQGYFTNRAGTRLTFHDGILSKAGGVPSKNNNNSNTFLCEFVGSDKYTYHLYFMLLPAGSDYVFVACPLVRVTASQEIDEEGTVYYEEEFVYGSSLINYEDYTANSAYYPTIKYKGELICASGWSRNKDKGEYRFISNEYDGNTRYQYLYILNMEFDEDDKFVSATSAKYVLTAYTNRNYTVHVWKNVDSDELFEVYAIGQSSTSYVKESVRNDDGSFNIVTTDNLYYRITIVIEGEEATLTVERLEAPVQPGGGEEVETPEETQAA